MFFLHDPMWRRHTLLCDGVDEQKLFRMLVFSNLVVRKDFVLIHIIIGTAKVKGKERWKVLCGAKPSGTWLLLLGVAAHACLRENAEK